MRGRGCPAHRGHENQMGRAAPSLQEASQQGSSALASGHPLFSSSSPTLALGNLGLAESL